MGGITSIQSINFQAQTTGLQNPNFGLAETKTFGPLSVTTAAGDKVAIMATAYPVNGSANTMTVKRNAVELQEFDSSLDTLYTLFVMDTPGAGTFQYAFDVFNGGLAGFAIEHISLSVFVMPA